jgi:hypothetical protein
MWDVEEIYVGVENGSHASGRGLEVARELS